MSVYTMEDHAQSTESLLHGSDCDDAEKAAVVKNEPWKARTVFTSMLLLSAMAVISLGVTWTLSPAPTPSRATNPVDPGTQTCSRPPTRREWRSLTTGEKNDYISAVTCLYTTRSQLKGEGSLLDDLTWVHIVQDAHDSALFLPWHRMFLHIYEQNLRDYCGFQGQLPYWDWATDWQDLGKSSIWNDEDGFGGETKKVSKNGCVTGPFGDLQVLYGQNGSLSPHCLSRRFSNYESGEAGTISGDLIKPTEMGRLARAKDYGSFRYILEGFAHNFFHLQIDGDLNTAAAPNDPLFWLHHAQLDRLWWLWQEEDPRARYQDYSESEQQPLSSGLASMKDELQYGGLAETTLVGDVMTIASDLLCYRY